YFQVAKYVITYLLIFYRNIFSLTIRRYGLYFQI
ncbi:unnamed protein product, partial [Brassica rapa subsp. narinosa]